MSELNSNTQNCVVLGQTYEGEKLNIKIADGTIFTVPKDWVLDCTLIKNLLEMCDDEDSVLTLAEVKDYETFSKILEFCEYHHNNKLKEISKPLKGLLVDEICEWDKNFFKFEKNNKSSMDKILLQNMIQLANYLDYSDLLQICAAVIAENIKGMTTEEMREYFGVENDFTPEEEQKIREENKFFDE
jgi:S-phase kinase-associated protein 1